MFSKLGYRKAFTVVEVLVFSSILLVLMGSIVLVVMGGMRYMRLGTAYQDAQRETLVGVTKMAEDLSISTAARRGPASPLVDSDHLVFLTPVPPPPAVDWTYNGKDLQYHAWICYYFDAPNSALVRMRWPLPAPATSNELGAPPSLADFLSDPTGLETKVVARNIDSLLINEGATGQQVSIRISGSVATSSDRATTVTNRTMVTMPNS